MTTLSSSTGLSAGASSGQVGVPPTTARREIAVFLATVSALMTASTLVGLREGVDVRHIEDASPLGATAMYTQAFFPFVGVIAARLSVGRGLRRAGLGFRRVGLATLGRAWGFALLAGLVPAVLLWVTGLVGFHADALTGIAPLGLTLLVLPYVVLALGEDVGWRGLLVTRLAAIASPRTVVWGSGLAWAAFHAPLMIWLGGTPEGVPVAYTVLVFAVGVVAYGAVLASMQLCWGIWPGVLTHAVLNAAMYHVVDPLSTETSAQGWLAGETGLVAAAVMIVLALLWWRRFPLVRTPTGTTEAREAATLR